MNRCLSCKNSCFIKIGRVDKLICEIDETPDDNVGMCDKYMNDEEFLKTGSLSVKDKCNK